MVRPAVPLSDISGRPERGRRGSRQLCSVLRDSGHRARRNTTQCRATAHRAHNCNTTPQHAMFIVQYCISSGSERDQGEKASLLNSPSKV